MDYDEWNDKKLEALTKAYVSRIDENAVKRAVTANIKLERAIGRKKEGAILKKTEKYLLERAELPKVIAQARSRLNIPLDIYVSELNINEWIDENSEPRLFYEVVKSTLEELKLGSEWSFYITMFIVNNQPPDKKYVLLRPDNGVSVEEVGVNGELLIRLRPGVRKEDYLKAWEAFREYLGSPNRIPKEDTESERDSGIYNDFSDGVTRRELAHKYFPGQEESSAMDRIIKILKRQKARRTRK